MEQYAMGFFSVAGVVIAIVATLSLLLFSLAVFFKSRRRAQLNYHRELIGDAVADLAKYYPSIREWVSVSAVMALLESLRRGYRPDIDHMRDYDIVDYKLNPQFSDPQVMEILENLDSQAQHVNVGDVTGVGDDLLPTLENEAARLIRTLLIRNNELHAQITATESKKHNSEYALDQWWVKELRNVSATTLTSVNLVRACAVAVRLAEELLPESVTDDDDDDDENSLMV